MSIEKGNVHLLGRCEKVIIFINLTARMEVFETWLSPYKRNLKIPLEMLVSRSQALGTCGTFVISHLLKK